MSRVRFPSPASLLSGFLLGSFAASFAGLCSPSGLVELLDRRLGRSTAGHIAADDPLNLILAPSQNFCDHADRQSGNIEFRRCGSSQIVEVQVALVHTSS